MKELNLPKEISIRLYTDGEQPKSKASGEDSSSELTIIEANRLDILTATIMIEDRMIEAVSKILFETDPERSRHSDFFTNEIMSVPDFNYAFKRKVFTRLLESFEILEPDKIKKLKSGLNNIMKWRNSFAHGKVLHEVNGGYLLQYYSGGHQELILDDKLFDNVETTIRACLYTCNGIIQSK
jgi:hypothetical protein